MADAKSKILIVEDDLDVAEMLNTYFRVQGGCARFSRKHGRLP